MENSSFSIRKLKGKVVIITRGASGIGETTVCLFANHGARAIVIADIQDDLGQKVVESISLDICSYFHFSDEDQVRAMVDWTVKNYGQLDLMFSNAGIFIAATKSDQKILNFDLFSLDGVFAINMRVMDACVKHDVRVTVERHVKGNIICTCSVVATTSGEKVPDYFMSKYAVLGLMRCARKQLGKYGIRVNTVSPYLGSTPHALKTFNMDVEEFEKSNQLLTSLKDIALKANPIADAVLFLASDDSPFITRHNLVVDGGFTA